MTRDGFWPRLLSLVASLALIAGQAAPAWAGTSCPHHHAGPAQPIAHEHGTLQHSHAADPAQTSPKPPQPCPDCDGHAGMTMDQCVMVCIGVAVSPVGSPAMARSATEASFILPPSQVLSGLSPEC